MDANMLASTSATILGLVIAFKGGRESGKIGEQVDFLEWLVQHNHRELKELILEENRLLSEIEKIVRLDSESFKSELQTVHGILAQVLSKLDGLGGIYRAIEPENQLP